MKRDDSNAVSIVIAKTIKYKGRLSSNEVAKSSRPHGQHTNSQDETIDTNADFPVIFGSYRKVSPKKLKFFTVHIPLRMNWTYASIIVN